MGLEHGAVVEKLDGAWSAKFSFRPGAWSGDHGTIDPNMERRCKNRAEHRALETPERAPEREGERERRTNMKTTSIST